MAGAVLGPLTESERTKQDGVRAVPVYELALELDYYVLNICYLKIWGVYKPKNQFLHQQNATGLLYMMHCGLTVRIKGDTDLQQLVGKPNNSFISKKPTLTLASKH